MEGAQWSRKGSAYLFSSNQGKVCLIPEGDLGVYLLLENNSGKVELRYRNGKKALEHFIPAGQETCDPGGIGSYQPLIGNESLLEQLPTDITRHFGIHGGLGKKVQ